METQSQVAGSASTDGRTTQVTYDNWRVRTGAATTLGRLGNFSKVLDHKYSITRPRLVLRQDKEFGLNVVDLAKDPIATGPLARSTTRNSKLDRALGVGLR